MVAISPDTVPGRAEVGPVQFFFAFKPWPEVLPTIEEYRSLFEKLSSRASATVLTADLCYCDSSADRAYELAHNYVGKYFDSFAEHYEIFGSPLTDSKSYANYSGAKAALDAVGIEAMVEAFVESNVWGTPK